MVTDMTFDPAYEKYMEDMEREYELVRQNGGRERCPHCDQFAITQRTVNPADPTVMRHCENCGMEEFFGDWIQREPGKRRGFTAGWEDC